MSRMNEYNALRRFSFGENRIGISDRPDRVVHLEKKPDTVKAQTSSA